MKAMIPALLVVMLSACATGPEPAAQFTPKEAQQLAKLLDGKTPGKPVSCISAVNGTNLRAIGNDTLVYRASSRLVYRNDLNGSCQGLSMGDTLVLQVRNSQYCRGDIARVVNLQTGMMSGACSLGDFVPYEAPKKPK